MFLSFNYLNKSSLTCSMLSQLIHCHSFLIFLLITVAFLMPSLSTPPNLCLSFSLHANSFKGNLLLYLSTHNGVLFRPLTVVAVVGPVCV